MAILAMHVPLSDGTLCQHSSSNSDRSSAQKAAMLHVLLIPMLAKLLCGTTVVFRCGSKEWPVHLNLPVTRYDFVGDFMHAGSAIAPVVESGLIQMPLKAARCAAAPVATCFLQPAAVAATSFGSAGEHSLHACPCNRQCLHDDANHDITPSLTSCQFERPELHLEH